MAWQHKVLCKFYCNFWINCMSLQCESLTMADNEDLIRKQYCDSLQAWATPINARWRVACSWSHYKYAPPPVQRALLGIKRPMSLTYVHGLFGPQGYCSDVTLVASMFSKAISSFDDVSCTALALNSPCKACKMLAGGQADGQQSLIRET